MNSLLDAVLATVERLPPDRVEAVAARLRSHRGTGPPASVEELVHTIAAREALRDVVAEGQREGVAWDYVAGLLVGASVGRQGALADRSVELAWTGPTGAQNDLRRTDQVLLDVVRRAERDLFLVSFVAYDVPAVVDALNAACGRGVRVRFLLESSRSEGGSLDVDPVGTMRSAVPGALVYAWTSKEGEHAGGRVHAKVAVADGRLAFVSSANLTGYALGKNMEAGVLVEGGRVPGQLHQHLRGLIDSGVISQM